MVKLGGILTQQPVDKMTTKTKGAWWLLSESSCEYSYDHLSNETKDILMEMLTINNHSNPLFAGVSAQVQAFGIIGLANAAFISGMKRKFLLSHGRLATDVNSFPSNSDLFVQVSEKLRPTTVVAVMQHTLSIRIKNTRRLSNQGHRKLEKGK